ncbi:Ppx/GppA family phosphatase [Sulfurovum sp. bin170]|uniref:Ppx/GppA phosphatase family protein n=1 Tax=Sulfurovum sp. bin170 TaxID=2695268 RepID=UPI0013DF31E0|nr:Ppx/GppA phosphatase family protein [Sulfurovum sp. bin170]NEW60041.1 Ppx/GppA family phosphatase [Sulfurovum sp. bin170]
MSEATAIIDIGSNSARLVIYQRSSQYGFHLICEKKSKVRIGEGAYEKGGYLQPIGIQRAYFALKEFINTIKLYPVTKVISVATSALRDAPNGSEFTEWIRDELGLDIEIIDGQKEARYGAIAALNLLPITDGITIDIGGGSSDLALIKESKIVDTYSLNIGTVRLKELFFDKGKSRKESQNFIREELKKLPSTFKQSQAIGIGGTARALSKAIMKNELYPLDKIHAFSYSVKSQNGYFSDISSLDKRMLSYLNLPKARFDTIREGTLIFGEILSHIGAKQVITSGVGVREGVFLDDFLKDNSLLFPKNINPSIRSMLDRFDTPHASEKSKESATKLFKLFVDNNYIDSSYLKSLIHAIELTPVGYTFNIYKSYQHAFYVTMHEFNYGVVHKEMILVAMLLRFGGKELYRKEIYKEYQELLPSKKEFKILSFIHSISTTLHENSATKSFEFSLDKKSLTIQANDSLYMVKEKLEEIERPSKLELNILDKQEIPAYRF